MQNWRLLVVRDPEKRRQIGEFYRAAFDEFYSRERLASKDRPLPEAHMSNAMYLADYVGTEPAGPYPVLSRSGPLYRATSSVGFAAARSRRSPISTPGARTCRGDSPLPMGGAPPGRCFALDDALLLPRAG